MDSFLGLIRVASKSDVERIDKKLATLNRHLKAVEKARKTNGASPSL